MTPAVFRARLRSVLEVDVTNELAALELPILNLCAMADNVVPRSATAFLQSIRPEMRLVEIEGPHCLLQVAPRDTARVITEFVALTNDMMQLS